MGPIDYLILGVVAVLVVLAVRAVISSRDDGCAGCGSKAGCPAHATGAPCPAARDMLKNVEERLGA